MKETLSTILKNIRKELEEKNEAREKSQRETRRVTSHSKQAILLIHQKRFDEAQKMISSAKNMLSKLGVSRDERIGEIMDGGLSAAWQEYSEANIFYVLVKDSKFITPQELDVPSVEYVLGLADVIGELRRLVLDHLREGNVKKAEENLQIMDKIYLELLALDESYMLVPGLRRKSDVARKIIEITRGDVTQEIRRSSLETHLKRLELSAKKKTK